MNAILMMPRTAPAQFQSVSMCPCIRTADSMGQRAGEHMCAGCSNPPAVPLLQPLQVSAAAAATRPSALPELQPVGHTAGPLGTADQGHSWRHNWLSKFAKAPDVGTSAVPFAAPDTLRQGLLSPSTHLHPAGALEPRWGLGRPISGCCRGGGMESGPSACGLDGTGMEHGWGGGGWVLFSAPQQHSALL